MDYYDRQIVSALLENGRASFAELARRVNLSPPAVAERVAKLEASGIITGYHAAVNLKALGQPIECLIALTLHRTSNERLLAELATIPQLTACYRVTGEACVMLKAAVADMLELEALIDRLMQYGMSKTSMILSTPFERTIPASLQSPERSVQRKSSVSSIGT
ncbi:transcriptional regulator, AsnC family [Pseudomonas duriflava]|uniref:Transcriptional regulator, AsnC family n=1 Tax=Pseudomonas duriflava TaxID=459528 RepID=A0A562QFV2_9PSED|nr:Lrp/AsnC family transcriptional regulator [Pseudomonas duriflava]TWI55573.1 transcriptional regulator, AsnC family [Pseudomonas duriflava]